MNVRTGDWSETVDDIDMRVGELIDVLACAVVGVTIALDFRVPASLQERMCFR